MNALTSSLSSVAFMGEYLLDGLRDAPYTVAVLEGDPWVAAKPAPRVVLE